MLRKLTDELGEIYRDDLLQDCKKNNLTCTIIRGMPKIGKTLVVKDFEDYLNNCPIIGIRPIFKDAAPNELFSWESVEENKDTLIQFLVERGNDWARYATVNKNDVTITIENEGRKAEITKNKEGRASLNIDDGTTFELKSKEVNGKLAICTSGNLDEIVEMCLDDLAEFSGDNTICIIIDSVNNLNDNPLERIKSWKEDHPKFCIHLILSFNKPIYNKSEQYKDRKVCYIDRKVARDVFLDFTNNNEDIVNQIYDIYRGHQGFMYMAIDEYRKSQQFFPDQLPKKVKKIFEKAAMDLSKFIEKIERKHGRHTAFYVKKCLLYIFTFFLFCEKTFPDIEYDYLLNKFPTIVARVLNELPPSKSFQSIKNAFENIITFVKKGEELCRYNQAKNEEECIMLYPTLIKWLLEEKTSLFEQVISADKVTQDSPYYGINPEQVIYDDVWEQFKQYFQRPEP